MIDTYTEYSWKGALLVSRTRGLDSGGGRCALSWVKTAKDSQP